VIATPSIRPASAADEPTLWLMLTHAATMEPPGPAAAALARSDPYLASYVAGWGRPGDLGVIAEDPAGPAGAAWLRVVGDPAHRARMGTGELPELAIAVSLAHRGQGLGTALLDALIPRARQSYPGIALSVRADNPAVRLYLRFGFRIEREVQNRVGTRSLVMRLDLAARVARDRTTGE
jgi:ribosomal protein S18 acetylase RimI-like enzyme